MTIQDSCRRGSFEMGAQTGWTLFAILFLAYCLLHPLALADDSLPGDTSVTMRVNGAFQLKPDTHDPEGWVRWSHPAGVATARFEVNPSDRGEGWHRVVIADGKESNGWFSEKALSLADIRKGLGLADDDKLSIEVRVRVRGKESGSASVNIEWQVEPEAGWLNKSGAALPWDTYDWMEASVVAEPPEKARFFKISLTTYNNAGKVEFEQVRVLANGTPLDEILDAPAKPVGLLPASIPLLAVSAQRSEQSNSAPGEAAPNQTYAAKPKPNAVDERINLSFDHLGDNGMPDNWRLWVVGESSSGRVLRDETVKRSGAASLRIENTRGMVGAFSIEPFDLHTIRRQLPVKAPIEFEVTAWIKTESTRSGSLAIEWFKNQLGGWHSKVEKPLPTATNDWTRVYLKASVPTDTGDGEHVTSVRLSVCTLDDPGTLWIDDLEVSVNGTPLSLYFIDALLAEEKPSRHARRIVATGVQTPIWTELASRRVQVDSRPVARQADRIKLRAARRESVSLQLVIPASGQQKTITTRIERQDQGDRTWSAAEWLRVGQLKAVFVPSAADGAVRRRGWVYDPVIFPVDSSFITTPGQNTVLILDATIPEDAEPGVYFGMLRLSYSDQEEDKVPFELTVLPILLPEQPQFKVYGNLWQESVRLYDNRRWEELLPAYATLFQQARVRGMSVGLPAMRLDGDEVTLDSDDAERFLREIGTLERHGITDYLSGAGPWVNTGLSYLGALKWPKDAVWEPTPGRKITLMSEEFRKLYTAYHKALGTFLESKGLIDRVLLYVFDEPYDPDAIPMLREVCKLIKLGHPRLKTYITILPSVHLPQLDTACPVAQHFPDGYVDPAFRSDGREVHVYNNWLYFVDSQPLCARVTPWMAHKHGITGYLFWSVNFWTAGDVWKEARLWGDGYLLYPSLPEPAGSLRWLNWRDGITDYDYLTLLDQHVNRLRPRLDLSSDQLKTLAYAEQLQMASRRIVDGLTTWLGSSSEFEELRTEIATAIVQLSSIQ